ncbi:uncharacterized protein LOC131624436 [Vicia villosa]|uniref:uncharacterized protein LOC131624436 n=1 Tax=Vicia villosa TaxID=3911 RepID=UPI00273B5A21|nr:uncharacterized protein LOC131624436 [Vicia villosa]
MASSSKKQVGSSSQQQNQDQQQQQLVAQKTYSIPLNELEVICEMMVDFDNLEAHDTHLKEAMIFQRWQAFFYGLCGPIYPDLVKEFWVHATVMPKAILSIVHGELFSTTENLLRKLFGLETVEGVSGAVPGRIEWEVVYEEIFKNDVESTEIKELKPSYRILAKILLGCIYHKKATVSSNYVSKNQQYIMYCIGKQEKVDLPFIIFNHMWQHVKESRDEFRKKNPKFKRNIIPFGRIITDLLVQTKSVEDLEKAGIIKDPYIMIGSTMNAHILKKMGLIETIGVTPQVNTEVRSRKAPALADFELFFRNEHPEVVVQYIAMHKAEGSDCDPIWISKQNLATTTNQVPELVQEKERRTKRKLDLPEIAPPDISPEKAPTKPPPTIKVSIPSSSPKSKGKSPILDSEPLVSEPILEPTTLNTIIPPHAIISTSKPPPHSNYEPVDTAVFFHLPSSESSLSDSFIRLMQSYNCKNKPSSDPVVVVLDSDNEAESSRQPSSSETLFVLDRESQPYAFFHPEKPISSLNPKSPISPPRTKPPKPSVDAHFDLLNNKVRTSLEVLKVAHDSKLDHKDCLAAAPGPSGFFLEYDDVKYYHPITNWKSLEEKQVNPLEKAHELVYPEVEYPPEPEIPVFKGLPSGEISVEDIPAEENEDATMVEADAAHPVLEDIFVATSAGSSVLLNTMKELQHNQATLASRQDKQDDTYAEFRTWMKNQEETSKK